MRVAVFVKPAEDSEKGHTLDRAACAATGKFNQELVKAVHTDTRDRLARQD